jgi:uncharacterized membrane protein YphA (DoxX/SURF4 family)
MIHGIDDGLIPAARLHVAPLFVIFGVRKVRDYSGTLDQMVGLVFITGPEKYSIDALLGSVAP